MQQYIKELKIIIKVLAIIAATLAALCCLVALFAWSPLMGGITLFLLSPFFFRGLFIALD